VHRGNQEELSEAIHEKTNFLNEARANVRRRGEAKLAERVDDLDHNARVLTEAGLVSGYPFSSQRAAPTMSTGDSAESPANGGPTESQPTGGSGSRDLLQPAGFTKGTSLDAQIGKELRRRKHVAQARREKVATDAAAGAALADISNGVQTFGRRDVGDRGIHLATGRAIHKEGENNDGKRCRRRRKSGGGST